MDIDALATPAEHDSTPVVRTDFSDDAAWDSIVAAVTAPVDFGDADPDGQGEDGEDDGYEANVVPVVHRSFDGATADAIAREARPRHGAIGYLLLADAQSMREVGPGQDATLVYVDLTVTEEDEVEFDEVYGRHFRCVISEVASIEVNLSISNMDFHEFADYADEHGGVFRGFEE